MYKIALALLNGVNDKAKEHGEMGVGRDTQTASLRLRLISENHVRARLLLATALSLRKTGSSACH